RHRAQESSDGLEKSGAGKHCERLYQLRNCGKDGITRSGDESWLGEGRNRCPTGNEVLADPLIIAGAWGSRFSISILAYHQSDLLCSCLGLSSAALRRASTSAMSRVLR